MIPVKPVPEPSEFDQRARQPGKTWLAQNPEAKRPHDYWSPFREILADACDGRCAYTAMLTTESTIDHFRSYKTHPELTYEWSNYRHAGAWINSVKKHREVVDPHEVGDGWFEILLPSMLLVMTDNVPEMHRPIVSRTMLVLRLSDHPKLVKLRTMWYEMYKSNDLSLAQLSRVAPLIAAAVEKQKLTTKQPR